MLKATEPNYYNWYKKYSITQLLDAREFYSRYNINPDCLPVIDELLSKKFIINIPENIVNKLQNI